VRSPLLQQLANKVRGASPRSQQSYATLHGASPRMLGRRQWLPLTGSRAAHCFSCRYRTGTVIGWPLSAIKQPRTRAGSVMLAFLM
jgi:hypothetical protein